MVSAFLFGIILALGLIVPLGIQNLFVFNQGATQKHYLYAVPSVMTAFICDAILIISAICGISGLILNIPVLKNSIIVFSIFFLIYMGLVTWNSSSVTASNRQALSIKEQVCFCASVSLLNPHAIIDTIAVVGTNSLHFSGQAKLAYTLACICVSLFWFFGLSVAGHYFSKLNNGGKNVALINKISALFMLSTAIYFGFKLIQKSI
jgi:L-lysine exporter family protein LysE/ArgO